MQRFTGRRYGGFQNFKTARGNIKNKKKCEIATWRDNEKKNESRSSADVEFTVENGFDTATLRSSSQKYLLMLRTITCTLYTTRPQEQHYKQLNALEFIIHVCFSFPFWCKRFVRFWYQTRPARGCSKIIKRKSTFRGESRNWNIKRYNTNNNNRGSSTLWWGTSHLRRYLSKLIRMKNSVIQWNF